MIPALLPTYAPFPLEMQQGIGERIIDGQGRAWLDFYGGHCVCATGHSHPRVVEAIAAQARELLFYSAAGELAVRRRAAEALVRFVGSALAGGEPASVFFCNSGAEANENALKIALKQSRRRRLAAVQGGWHGRSLLCLSVTDDPPITAPYAEHLLDCERLPLNDIEAARRVDWSTIAALILEPIQSMSGVRCADPLWLAELRRLTAAHGTLLIFDEIQTGMGRLGAPFAAHLHGVAPDIITSAKGLASGVPIGAVLMSQQVAAGIGPGDLGSTFGGGPLACAALEATIAVIEDEGLMARAVAAQARIRTLLPSNVVRELRGAGLLLGLDCGPHAGALKKALLAERMLVGGASDPAVLRLMPPLTISDAAVDALGAALARFAESI